MPVAPLFLGKPYRGDITKRGRRPLVPNFPNTGEIREAIIEGCRQYGYDGKGEGGLTGWMKRLAGQHPAAMATLIAKLLPLEVSGPDGGAIAFEEVDPRAELLRHLAAIAARAAAGEGAVTIDSRDLGLDGGGQPDLVFPLIEQRPDCVPQMELGLLGATESDGAIRELVDLSTQSRARRGQNAVGSRVVPGPDDGGGALGRPGGADAR